MSRRAASSAGGDEQSLFRIAPYHYIHVLDQNSNVTRVEAGPLTFIRQDNEKVVFGPERMVTVPPRHYCIVENPVVRSVEDQSIVFEVAKGAATQQARLRHADKEVRLAQEPFALYPGEVLLQGVTPLEIVTADSALRLTAINDCFEPAPAAAADGADGAAAAAVTQRVAGDEWLFEGPGTYIPRVQVEVVETVVATVIKPNQALRVRARKECRDRQGRERVTGEEWLIRQVGAYLPGVFEEVVDVVNAYVLTEKVALHMQATRTFTDGNGVVRRTGEEWLITFKQSDTHIPEVYEVVVGVVDITTLNNRQYAVICNPCGADGKPQLGQRKLIKGPCSFFLLPGESLEKNKIQDVYILGEHEGLILRAAEKFHDDLADQDRLPGDRWMIRGPMEYVPPVELEVVTKREAIPLDDNEGIYVRDVKSGKIRAVIGETYMLSHNEELWAKQLPPAIEQLLSSAKDPLADRSRRGGGGGGGAAAASGARDKTRVVSFRVPHNAAVQIYDFKEKKARVVFGPELVMLGPEEQFTQLSLSGGKPKKPNQIKSLCLLLGPDFCTDIITIETSDHARLSLQLSYNWHFEVDKTDTGDAAKLFSVPDFVGDLCKAIASRIRGAVSSVQFDDFHKNSAKIIRSSVFGVDPETKKVKDKFGFPANNLCITSIDIQNVEPVDQRTRDALQKSVQLAIEITTNSQEATARHEAQRLEQAAKGDLERQKIQDEAAAEESRKNLLELQALSAAVESSGQAKAEAQSRAEAARIEGEAAVQQARLKAEAMQIESEAELKRLSAAREAETVYVREQNEIEVSKAAKLMEIEVAKFKQTVDAIGTDTIARVATAGPEMKVKLLQSLGLKTTLITDGNSPINLFNTANGLVGSAGGALEGAGADA